MRRESRRLLVLVLVIVRESVDISQTDYWLFLLETSRSYWWYLGLLKTSAPVKTAAAWCLTCLRLATYFPRTNKLPRIEWRRRSSISFPRSIVVVWNVCQRSCSMRRLRCRQPGFLGLEKRCLYEDSTETEETKSKWLVTTIDHDCHCPTVFERERSSFLLFYSYGIVVLSRGRRGREALPWLLLP